MMSELERQVQSLLQACFHAAEGLDTEDWLNRRFLQLESLLLSDREFGTEIPEMEQEVSQSWSGYSKTPVLPQEVTVLNRVFHLVMTEVFQHWMLAFEIADGTATEESVEGCLAAAEWACRLTSVLESLSVEVQERVAA